MQHHDESRFAVEGRVALTQQRFLVHVQQLAENVLSFAILRIQGLYFVILLQVCRSCFLTVKKKLYDVISVVFKLADDIILC